MCDRGSAYECTQACGVTLSLAQRQLAMWGLSWGMAAEFFHLQHILLGPGALLWQPVATLSKE